MSAVPAVQPRLRALIVSPRLVLAGIVVVGTSLQVLLARAVISPSFFPDEYLYSQLGSSLARDGNLRVRGVPAHFLPVLQPLLTAPVWFAHSVETSFRLVQLENALAFSLAAVPAYLIARRLSVGVGLSLGVATLAVSGPPAMCSAFFLSEPYAYPLSLAVVAAMLAAFDRPSLRAQAVLLGLSALASFDRLQLAALPLCAAVAVVAVGVREGRLRRVVREQWLLLGVIAVGALATLTITLVHGLGFYQLQPRTAGPLGALRFGGVSLYVVAVAVGGAIVPSALVGLGLALAKPRTRLEFAFGTFTAALTGAIVVQCVIWGDVHRVQERYLGYLLPLLGIAFALRMTRRERRRLPELGVAALVACVAALVPLTGYEIDANHDLAPTLYALARLQNLLDSPARASELMALGVTVLAAVGLLGRRVALTASIAASLALLVLSMSWSGALSRVGRYTALPSDVSWVDHRDAGDATMLVVGRAWSGQALATLLWNPSVSRVLMMKDARKIDWLDHPQVQVDASGTVRLHGTPLRGDVLVANSPASAVVFRDARRLGDDLGSESLWRPRDTVRLAAIMNNRFPDGRVLHSGGIVMWSPTASFRGWIELTVHAPASLGASRVSLVGKTVSVPAGKTRTVRLAACGTGRWEGGFVANPVTTAHGRWASPLVSLPRYVPDPRACS